MSIGLQLLVATVVMVIEKDRNEYAGNTYNSKAERLVIKREGSGVRHTGLEFSLHYPWPCDLGPKPFWHSAS